MSNDTETLGDWSERVEEASLIAPEPVDDTIRELERRLQERREEQPERSPTVSLRFVLDLLLEARNRAAVHDSWLTYKEISEIPAGDGPHPETVRRKAQDLPDGLVRENGLSGKHEVHAEGVAQIQDVTIDDAREAA